MKSLEGFPVVIYDSENNYITKAIIQVYDKSDMSIEISEELPDIRQGTRLSLLVIHPGGASEFSGIARRMHAGMREISLFNERQREARTSARHSLNEPAVINNLIVNAQKKALPAPLSITVENISTTGALVIAPEESIALGDVLEIDINISGQAALLYGAVVRAQPIGDGLIKFGCRFVFFEQSV